MSSRATPILLAFIFGIITGCASECSPASDRHLLDLPDGGGEITCTDADGDPLANREIRLELDRFPAPKSDIAGRRTYTAYTDDRGRFHFRGFPLPPDAGIFWIRHEGRWHPIAEASSLRYSLSEDAEPGPIEWRLDERKHRFRLRVLDAVTSLPIEGATIRLAAHSETAPTDLREIARTDAQGEWASADHEAYWMWHDWVERDGYAPFFARPYHFLDRDDSERIDEIVLLPGREIEVTVVDPKEQPLPLHWVDVRWPNPSGNMWTSVWHRTGLDGRVRMTVPAVDSYAGDLIPVYLRLIDEEKREISTEEIEVTLQMTAVTLRSDAGPAGSTATRHP